MIRRKQTKLELLRATFTPDRCAEITEHFSNNPPESYYDACLSSVADAIHWFEVLDGRQFIVSETIQELFRFTDVKNIPIESFKCPFDVQYFEADPLMNGAGGLFVLQRDHEPGFYAIDIISVRQITKDDGKKEGLAGLVIIRMTDDKDVLEYIENSFDHLEKEEKEKTKKIVKFVFNCLAFINSTSYDPKRESWDDIDSAIGREKGKRRCQRKESLKNRYILSTRIGESIKIDGTLRKRLSECKSDGGSLSVRFLVRGHWRHQWVGSGNIGDRRQEVIWIRPFWKGDEALPLKKKDYELIPALTAAEA